MRLQPRALAGDGLVFLRLPAGLNLSSVTTISSSYLRFRYWSSGLYLSSRKLPAIASCFYWLSFVNLGHRTQRDQKCWPSFVARRLATQSIVLVNCALPYPGNSPDAACCLALESRVTFWLWLASPSLNHLVVCHSFLRSDQLYEVQMTPLSEVMLALLASGYSNPSQGNHCSFSYLSHSSSEMRATVDNSH